MNCNYYIYKDIFYFKPNFNEVMNDYIEIIKDYKSLIFSNCTDLKIVFGTNNLYDNKYHHNYLSSRYNQPLSNSLANLIMLE